MRLTNDPGERVSISADENTVRQRLCRDLYPLDVIYSAAYLLLDRCFVYLDAPDPVHVDVFLKGKETLTESQLEELAGIFSNELVSAALRNKVASKNKAIIEAVAVMAMTEVVGVAQDKESGLDSKKTDLSTDALDDPLGITMSWEEKYGDLQEKASSVEESKLEEEI